MTADALKNIDEALLINYCKDNNTVAQKIIYNRYVEDMLLLCLRYIVNREDAKEVLMDGFFSFFKNIHTFTWQGQGSAKAWLKKIVVNQCLMHLRKRKDLFVKGKEVEQYEHADGGSNAIDELNAKELLAMIHALPDGYRTVFNLYFFEGMNHREIGELLQISDNTSKSQLSRARAMLKAKIVEAS